MHGPAWVLTFGPNSHSPATQPRSNSAGSADPDGSRDSWRQLGWQEWQQVDQGAMDGAAAGDDDPMGGPTNDDSQPPHNDFTIHEAANQEDTFLKIEVSYAKKMGSTWWYLFGHE